MSRVIEFVFDFGSPNAYLAHRVLPAIAARTGAEIRLLPCLLGGIFKATDNRSPLEAFAPVKGKLQYEWREVERFTAKHGITDFRINPHFPLNTLLIMRGLIVAEDEGVAGSYVEAIASGMWVQGLKMDDPTVVAGVLTSAGLDAAHLLGRTQEGAIKQRLIDNTNAAVARGVFGVPTFFVGEEMFFGKDRLSQVEEELMKAPP